MATHKPVEIDELFGELKISGSSEKWYVVHTKPQCEKKLAAFLKRNQCLYYLPLMDSVRQYKYRKITFTKPLFPGYVFTRFCPKDIASILISGYIVSLLKVPNEEELLDDLQHIYLGRTHKVEFKQIPWFDEGLPVEVISGPMLGLKGVVQSHDKLNEVILKVDLLRQAVSMTISPSDLKVLKRD